MNRKENIRNACLLANVGDGKTTLTNYLLSATNFSIISESNNASKISSNKENQGRPAVVKTLSFQLIEKDVISSDKAACSNADNPSKKYLVNIIDTPKKMESRSDMCAALQVVDGTLLVVDCKPGIYNETENLLRLAIAGQVKPVLFINKLDRILMERSLNGEQVYQLLECIVDDLNNIIKSCCDSSGPMGNILFEPTKGNVAFGSALQGWAFTLDHFAEVYSKKLGIDAVVLNSRLWGKNFFDVKTNKWSNKESKHSKLSFVLYVLDPIFKVWDAIMNFKKEEVNALLEELNIELSSEDKEKEGEALFEAVMKTWLPVKKAVLNMVVVHLPSPIVAQQYRITTLYNGALMDKAAIAIKNCDPDSLLMMFVSKIVSSPVAGRSCAFGRIFSGKLSVGQKIKIMGPEYGDENNEDSYEAKVEKIMLMTEACDEEEETITCGNVCGVVAVERNLIERGTITSYSEADNIKRIKSMIPFKRKRDDSAEGSSDQTTDHASDKKFWEDNVGSDKYGLSWDWEPSENDRNGSGIDEDDEDDEDEDDDEDDDEDEDEDEDEDGDEDLQDVEEDTASEKEGDSDNETNDGVKQNRKNKNSPSGR